MYSPKSYRKFSFYKRDNKPEINITPMMDICLILLVTFMSVTPSIISGIDVSMPKSNNGKGIARFASSNPITISYNQEKNIYVDNKKVKPSTFISEINNISHNQKETPIFIKADRSNSYGNVIMLMEQLHKVGYTNTILVTEPYAVN